MSVVDFRTDQGTVVGKGDEAWMDDRSCASPNW